MFPPPSTLTLSEDLEGLTVSLPPRFDLRRLGLSVGLMWMALYTLCFFIMLVPEFQRSGQWNAGAVIFLLLISAGLAHVASLSQPGNISAA